MVVTVLSAGCGVSSNDVAQAAPREHAAHTHAERDPDRLWCNEHGVYEDECTICHPELAAAAEERDPNRLWCNEHGVYEDECTICHPEMASESEQDDDGHGHDNHSGGAEVLWCKEHDVAEGECGLCHPELVADLEPGQGMKVRFESDASVTKAGVEVGRPSESTMLRPSRSWDR